MELLDTSSTSVWWSLCQFLCTTMSRLELKAEAATAGTSMENNSSLVAFGTMSLAPQNAEGYTKEMPAHGRYGSLGRSQEGEVRFLEVSGFTYCQMTIEDFVYHYHDKSPEDKKKIVRDFILFIQSSKSRCAQKEAARKSHANSIRLACGDSSAIVPLRLKFSEYIFDQNIPYMILTRPLGLTQPRPVQNAIAK